METTELSLSIPYEPDERLSSWITTYRLFGERSNMTAVNMMNLFLFSTATDWDSKPASNETELNSSGVTTTESP